jgi:hypothetical protein
MSAGFAPLVNAIFTLCSATGHFRETLAHEPASAPGSEGLVCAIWGSEMRPVQTSGLDVISARMEITVRIHKTLFTEPKDQIDLEVFAATDAVMSAIIGDFTLRAADPTLAGVVRQVDLLGSDGDGLRAVAAYVQIDQTKYRCMDIFVPVIINDCWTVG